MKLIGSVKKQQNNSKQWLDLRNKSVNTYIKTFFYFFFVRITYEKNLP
jgi:hypothetical protein